MKMEETKPIHKILLPTAVRALSTIAKWVDPFGFPFLFVKLFLLVREHWVFSPSAYSLEFSFLKTHPSVRATVVHGHITDFTLTWKITWKAKVRCWAVFSVLTSYTIPKAERLPLSWCLSWQKGMWVVVCLGKGRVEHNPHCEFWEEIMKSFISFSIDQHLKDPIFIRIGCAAAALATRPREKNWGKFPDTGLSGLLWSYANETDENIKHL